ncbi:MAG: bifunctional DedA family/phosphatase PAP2 family protein [Acidobacteria bacterium]|nr:bifunctional DedA family/phosphatase PAP2 family protein [Acidobacteriota bacterium]
MDLPAKLINLFTSYGYIIVFFGVMLENAGIPIPGETILLAAGFFASQGHFSVLLVILSATTGAILGDNLSYLAGRRLGRPFIERYGHLVWLTPVRIEAGERFFERHGNKTILFARFISGLRIFAAFFAGMSQMRRRTFLVYNSAGALLWATTISLIGYFFGNSWELIEKLVGRAGLFITGIIVVWAAVALLGHWRRQVEAGADRARPQMLELHEISIVLFNLALVALFVRLSYAIAHNRDPRFDERVMLLIHEHSTPWLDVTMRVITHGGDPLILIIVSAALAWFFFKRYQRRREGLTLLLALALGYALNNSFKYAFQRERPDFWEMIARLHSYSFPSGHAMVSMAVYGSAAYLLEAAFPRYRWSFRIFAPALVLLIGASRVYLGVHWPSDVLAGYAAGLVIVFAAAYWHSRGRTSFEPSHSEPR